MTVEPKKRTSFLELPAEIRNMILEYHFLRQRPVHISFRPVIKLPHPSCSFLVRNQHIKGFTHETFESDWSYIPHPGWPPITLTCTRLREQALPIYYGNNAFIIGEHEYGMVNGSRQIKAMEWLRRLGDHAEFLRDVMYVTGNLYISKSFGRAGVVEVPHRMATRIWIVEDGSVAGITCKVRSRLRCVDDGSEFCVCDVLSLARDEGRLDGKRLLELLDEWNERWVYNYAEHRNPLCEICRYPKLERHWRD